MNPTKPQLPFAGYIRVSKTAGRSGESFISPDVQESKIRQLARDNGIELAEIVAELDVKGSTAIDVREIGRLVRQVEAKELGGLIVWKLSRFSRNLVDGILVADRITTAKGRVLADGFDSAQPMAKAMLGLMLGLAEEELDQRREGWGAAVESAIARGVYPATPPRGYSKDDTGRLVPDDDAPAVREAFQMRANGASLEAVAQHLGTGLSRQAAKKLLANRAYLGQIVHAQGSDLTAHPPLVSQPLWDNSQRSSGPRAQTGVMAGEGILAGHPGLVCGTCGRQLGRVRNGAKGSVSYACPKHGNGLETCPRGGSATARLLDALVMPGLEDRMQAGQVNLDTLEGDYIDARDAHQRAVALLEQAMTPDAQEVLEESWLAAVAQRREAVTAAATVAADAALAYDQVHSGEASQYDRLRLQARKLLVSVTVHPDTSGKGRWGNLADRVQIEWAESTGDISAGVDV